MKEQRICEGMLVRLGFLLVFYLLPLWLEGQSPDELNDVELSALSMAIEDQDIKSADSIIQILSVGSAWINNSKSADLALQYAALKSLDIGLTEILEITRSLLDQFSMSQELQTHRVRLLLRTTQACRQHSQVDSMQQYLLKTQQAIAHLKSRSFLESTYYYEFGRYAYLRHDFEGSMLQLRKGLDFVIAHFPDRVQTRLNFMNGIGIALRRLGRVEEALQHHLSTLEYIRAADASSPWVGNVLNNIGLCYSSLRQYDQAVLYQKEAVQSYRKLDERYRDQIATGYDNIGLSYSSQSQYDSAAHYSRLSLTYMQEQFGDDHPDLLLPLTSLGRIYLAANELFLADSFIQVAYQKLLDYGWSEEHPTGQFFLEDAFTLFNVGMQIRQEIVQQSKIQMPNIYDLKYARGFMATADHAFYDVQSERSRTAFLSNHRTKFVNVIRQYYSAYQHSASTELFMEALNAIEKYKSYQLSALAYRDRVANSDTFKKLNAKHRQLLTEIRIADQKVSTFAEKDEIPDSLSKLVEEANTEFQLWQAEVKKTHPSYVGIIRKQEPIDIDDIRHDLLKKKQGVVSYFLDTNQVYVLYLDAQDEQFFRMDAAEDIASMVQSLSAHVTAVAHTGLGNEELYFKHITAYARVAEALYHTLLAPLADLTVDRLMIIPDGHLWYLPYEVLLMHKPDDLQKIGHLPYALNRFAMGYCYSLYLWRELANAEHHDVVQHKIMAPEFGIDEEQGQIRGARLARLAYNSLEASRLGQLLEVEPIIGEEATISAFKQDLDQQKIIHLSTHAITDIENDLGYLAFSDKENDHAKLLTEEIYDLELNADLVALSACESGLGRFELGGGLISLSRAFSYAGARSLISSLWPVSDFSTAQITQDIYRNLLRGEPKDVAIQSAKLNYLAESDHLGAHPFFWSSMIVTGDPSPIFSRTISSTVLIGLLAALLALVFFLYYKFQGPYK